MAEQSNATLKGYFNTGDTPTEAQFADLIDTIFGDTRFAAAFLAYISGLTEDATPTSDAVLAYLNDVGGTPIVRKITLLDLIGPGELFLTAAGGWPSTTSGCADNTKNEYATNDQDLYSLDFDSASDEFAQWTVWMPDDWDGGTITAKFVWTAASSTGTVTWGLQGRSYDNDDPIDASWGTAQSVTDTLIATGDIHITSLTAAITLAGSPAGGQIVQLRVYRDVSEDSLAADAKLLGVKVYYTKA